ncbi:protein-histidine kinase [Gigaspora margarita]|uniref:histidine kinase n=1 Tax=Gigaspora margarita TaxID=4874 RepID=A0A8H3XD31_GIGMA|nr:protein-histidine kinase [Gigaspora margarita]
MTNQSIKLNDGIKDKSQTLINLQKSLDNNPGIDVFLDVYCDNVCKNVSLLSAEIRLDNICWGWIKVHRSPNSVWFDSEIELLQQISNQISLGITYAYMLEKNAANEIKIKTAEAANRAKSQILANTSHELRTPLGAIIGILSSFDSTNLTIDQKEMINIMACGSDIVLSIVNDILDVAKLEAQKITLMNTTFDLLELFESTIESFGKKAGTKRIELIVNCEVDMLPRYIKSDPERLKQVLSNLLSNSIKFIKKGKIVVTISMQLSDVIDKDKNKQTYGQTIKKGNLLVELYDTGIGIDPEYIKHAWQSYSQNDMSMTNAQGGTGLGLSICKSLVEINGGEINVESQLGKGSKFWFTWNIEFLSITSLSNTTQFDQISYVLPHVIKKKRILIIHPLEDTRNALLNDFKTIKKIDAFETFDEGISAAKSYRELNNQSAYDVAFIGLYKDNEEEVMNATLELRGLEMNNNNLIIIFIVFPNNEENELAEKLIRKVGGIATVLHTPVTWKKLINQFMHMENSYSVIDIDNKKLDIGKIFYNE